jgi:peptidoglycan/LPS O-acetylase OafA/YrhL
LDSMGLVKTLVVVFIALGALAITDQVVSYGWKVFVLTKIFKIVWAIGLTLVLVALVRDLLPKCLGNSEPHEPPPSRSSVFTAIAALLVALTTLGYLLPDWNPWTEGIGALAATAWVLLLLPLAREGRNAGQLIRDNQIWRRIDSRFSLPSRGLLPHVNCYRAAKPLRGGGGDGEATEHGDTPRA